MIMRLCMTYMGVTDDYRHVAYGQSDVYEPTSGRCCFASRMCPRAHSLDTWINIDNACTHARSARAYIRKIIELYFV